ncbi:MAG: hypothetical protein ACJASH_002373 [Bermanella sp.]|jgi:hypothetical protein
MIRSCNSVADYQLKIQNMDEPLDDLDILIGEWLFYAELSSNRIEIKNKT